MPDTPAPTDRRPARSTARIAAALAAVVVAGVVGVLVLALLGDEGAGDIAGGGNDPAEEPGAGGPDGDGDGDGSDTEVAGQVFYVGDSLISRAVEDVERAFEDEGFEIDGSHHMGGTRIGWAATGLRDRLSDGGDVVVIASGTNNTMDGWTKDDRRDTLAALRRASNARCAVWVLPATVRFPVEDGERIQEPSAEAREVHDRIADLVERNPTIHIADWGAYAEEHPEWYDFDGIHHTAEGDRAYAEFIARQTREHCGTD